MEDKFNDKPLLEDKTKTYANNQVRGSPHTESILLHNNDKNTPKGAGILNKIELKCVLCEKIFKTEATLKTYDKRCHMKKGSDTEYCCQYCSKIFPAKIQMVEHITNQHKKCCVCNNIFPSDKVLEAHAKAVHRKVQFKHTIEREPSFKNHKNKKY